MKAFNHPDPDLGLRNAKHLAGLLGKAHPGAANSLREGLEEMFAVSRLGIGGRLAKTLVTSNPIESMISIARTTNRNVTRWRDSHMVLRPAAAGMLNAERSFRRIKGYKQMPQLIEALHRHAHREAASSVVTVGAAASGPPRIASRVSRDSGHPRWDHTPKVCVMTMVQPAPVGPQTRHHRQSQRRMRGPAFQARKRGGRSKLVARLKRP